MNKKATTLTVWIEVMFFSILFVIALGIIGTNMNRDFDSDKDLTFGIATNNTLQSIKNTQASLENSRQTGQSSFSGLGIFILNTMPNMLMTSLQLILDFAGGSWIRSLVGLLNLGDYTNIVTTIFQILYFFIIIFILIKLILRVQL